MIKPYFPDFGSQFTRTPNLFFDEVLRDGKLAAVKVVGCLIRQTLGFNNEAGWTGLSRSTIAKLMNMSLRSVTTGAQEAQKKGWILIYDDPRKGKESHPNYYFLNNLTNQLIVTGLKKQKFTVEDLEDLTLSGIKKLLIQSGLMNEDGNPLLPIENEEEKSSDENERLGREKFAPGGREKFAPGGREKFAPGGREKFAPVDEGQSHAGQGVSEPLNTTTKIHSLKYNTVVVVDKVIEKWNSLLVEKGEEPMTPELARDLLDDAKLNEEWVIKCIENVAKDYENVEEAIRAVRFAIQHYGWKPKKKKKNKKGGSKYSKPASKLDGLPKAIQKQMEQEAAGEQNWSDADPEAQARINEELRRMRERLKISNRIKDLRDRLRKEENSLQPNDIVIRDIQNEIQELEEQLANMRDEEVEKVEV